MVQASGFSFVISMDMNTTMQDIELRLTGNGIVLTILSADITECPTGELVPSISLSFGEALKLALDLVDLTADEDEVENE